MTGRSRPTSSIAPSTQRALRASSNRVGSVRFRHWRLYGERGLAGEAAVVWLYREQLTVAFADEVLAYYQVSYQPDDRHLVSATAAVFLETPYRSPQLRLWEWGDGE
jgi:hypothetical protein